MLHRIRVSAAALTAAFLLLTSLLAPLAVQAAPPSQGPSVAFASTDWLDALLQRLAGWLPGLDPARLGGSSDGPAALFSPNSSDKSPVGGSTSDGDLDPDGLPAPAPQGGGDMDPNG